MKFDIDKARELLLYDPETGDFTWIGGKRSRRTGKIAGFISRHGYRIISVRGLVIRAHRLAWIFTYGVIPKGDIDHINGVITDNRISNLRDVSKSVNLQNQRKAHSNNKSGFLGVSWRPISKKWIAQISLNRKVTIVGYFDDPKEAHEAYLAKKREIHEGCVI
jgi:hypothetical protein